MKASLALVLCLGTAGLALTALEVAPAAAAGPPAVTKVTPPSGLPTGGLKVAIVGANLSPSPTVDFGPGNPATVVTDTAGKIVVDSPPGSGTVNVTVTTSAGTSTIVPADQFTYEDAATVTALYGNNSPTSGGVTDFIQGTNLCGAESVHFATAAATSFTIENCNVISAVVPAMPVTLTAGKLYNTTVTTGDGTSVKTTANQFYWFGDGTCSFSGAGVVNGSSGPPGTTGYVTGASPGVEGTTGTVTNGGTTLSDPNANFTAGDVGDGIWVANAGAGSGVPLDSTIAAVDSSTQITLADATSQNLTGDATYGYGDSFGTSCTGLSGLALTSPLTDSLSDPEATNVAGSGPGGDANNEKWLGWSGAAGYFDSSGTTYTAPGDGFVLPASGPNTSGGCPLSPSLCAVGGASGSTPYAGTDPQGTCPPSQAQVDAGYVDCSVTTVISNPTNSYTASDIAVNYAGAPTPDAPSASLSPSTGLSAGQTVTVDSCDSCDWWGAGPSGAPGIVNPVGPAGSAVAIPAPTVWIGATRDTAVEATASTVAVTPNSYNCGASGGSGSTSPGPIATCILGGGTIGGTFTVPSGVNCTSCNVYIDEPNTTLDQGEYSGSGSYNDGLSYNLVNSVESSTPVSVCAGACSSSLSLTKSTTSSGYSTAGDIIPYDYLVTNTGETTISNVAVSDNLVASVSCPDSTLTAGASETCTGSYTVTQADVDAGSVTNTASASGTDPEDNTVTSNPSSVTVLEST